MALSVEGSNASSTTKESDLSQSSLGSGELIPQNERELRHPKGSSMLIGDPQGEGTNASSTNKELWRADNSFLRMRGNSDTQKGVACS